jgi:hypothetical protein
VIGPPINAFLAASSLNGDGGKSPISQFNQLLYAARSGRYAGERPQIGYPMASPRPPKLIAPYIKVLQGLDRGLRVPRTALQVHFVEVCRGVAQPTTEYERAYLVWRAKEQRWLKLEPEERAHQRNLHSSRAGQPPIVSPEPPGRWSNPKPYARFIAEPLGTREDYKRDSTANLADARRNRL